MGGCLRHIIIAIKCYLFLISKPRFPDKIYSNVVSGPPESISPRMSGTKGDSQASVAEPGLRGSVATASPPAPVILTYMSGREAVTLCAAAGKTGRSLRKDAVP